MNVYALSVNMHNRAGNFAACVFHYQLSEAGSFDPFEYADHLCTGWVVNAQTDFLKIIGADITLDFLSARRITGGGGTSATQTISAASTALSDGSSMSLCADVAWECNAPSNRLGHTYIPSVPQDQLAADTFANTYAPLVNAWISDMLAAITLAGGAGNAEFGMFTRKTQQFNTAKSGLLRPKVTALNKRTVPVI